MVKVVLCADASHASGGIPVFVGSLARVFEAEVVSDFVHLPGGRFTPVVGVGRNGTIDLSPGSPAAFSPGRIAEHDQIELVLVVGTPKLCSKGFHGLVVEGVSVGVGGVVKIDFEVVDSVGGALGIELLDAELVVRAGLELRFHRGFACKEVASELIHARGRLLSLVVNDANHECIHGTHGFGGKIALVGGAIGGDCHSGILRKVHPVGLGVDNSAADGEGRNTRQSVLEVVIVFMVAFVLVSVHINKVIEFDDGGIDSGTFGVFGFDEFTGPFVFGMSIGVGVVGLVVDV